MEDTIESMLALEARSQDSLEYLVYTCLPPEEANLPFLFIPLNISSTKLDAETKAKEIIASTGFKTILIHPMGKWMNLYRGANRPDRDRVEAEIRSEQIAMFDQGTIESYYESWLHLISASERLESLKKQQDQLEQASKDAINAIRTKSQVHPEYRDRWQDLFLSRLKSRGEELQGRFVIDRSNHLATVHNL